MMNQERKRLKYKPLSLEQLEDIYLQFSDEEVV